MGIDHGVSRWEGRYRLDEGCDMNDMADTGWIICVLRDRFDGISDGCKVSIA